MFIQISDNEWIKLNSIIAFKIFPELLWIELDKRNIKSIYSPWKEEVLRKLNVTSKNPPNS